MPKPFQTIAHFLITLKTYFENCCSCSMGFKIQEKIVGNKGSYFVSDATGCLAELNFSITVNHRISIDNTAMVLELKNTNIAELLVEKVLAFARKNQFKVITLCPIAGSIINSFGLVNRKGEIQNIKR